MSNSKRQLVIGSLQPFLFCVGMYFVVLIFSIFICTSIYRTINPKKYPTASANMEKQQPAPSKASLVSL